jgi:hypothetical protein
MRNKALGREKQIYLNHRRTLLGRVYAEAIERCVWSFWREPDCEFYIELLIWSQILKFVGACDHNGSNMDDFDFLAETQDIRAGAPKLRWLEIVKHVIWEMKLKIWIRIVNRKVYLPPIWLNFCILARRKIMNMIPHNTAIWRMVSSGLLRRVALVRTQKTPFFIVTAVKTSNLTTLPFVFVT